MWCFGARPNIRSAPLIRPEIFPKREPPPLFCLRGLDFPPLIDNPTVLTLANWQPNGLLTPYGPRFCPQVVDALGLLHNFPAKSMIPIDRGEGGTPQLPKSKQPPRVGIRWRDKQIPHSALLPNLGFRPPSQFQIVSL